MELHCALTLCGVRCGLKGRKGRDSTLCAVHCVGDNVSDPLCWVQCGQVVALVGGRWREVHCTWDNVPGTL